MQQAVEIKNKNSTLRGMLHIPDHKEGKIPTIIILHGFGGNKMGPHFMFVKLSRLLEENGFASVRFDFAGSGESDGDFVNMTLSGEIEDAKSILNYVKSLDFVDKDNIGVIGFSMGGAVASVLAGVSENDIKALCLWSPAGNIRDIVLNDFIGEGYPELIKNGNYEFDGLLVGKEFVEDLSAVDIYNEASKFNGNVLLLHGDSDEVVNISASNNYIKASYGEKARLVEINGADHLFTKNLWKKEMIEQSVLFFKEELLSD